MDNIISFGKALKDIRENLCLSKIEVSSLAGINEVTLRRIEQGKVIPKFETLDYLSEAYNMDIVELFMEYRIKDQDYYYELKRRIELRLNTDDISSLYLELKELKSFLKHVKSSYFKINIQQLILLIESILLYRNENKFEKSLEVIFKAIRLTNSDFKLNNYKSFVYSSLEIRLLMNISFILNRLNKPEKYVEILEFCTDTADTSDNIYPKLCHNLAGAYRRSKKLKRSLYYANLAIESAQAQQNYNGLYILYYGKALSEFDLGLKDYKKSLKTSLTLCDTFGQSRVKKIFIEKFKF